jgi:hypothetical protein
VTGRRWIAFGVCLLMSSGLAACSPSYVPPARSRSVSSPTSTSGQSTHRHIIAAIGGVIRVGGASLTVPAGSLDRDTDIALAVGGPPPIGAPALFQAAGPAIHGDLGGAHLTHGATLSLPLSSVVTGGVGAGYLDEQTGVWLPRQAVVDSRAHVLTLQVPHLSWYQPWTWDPAAVKSKLEQYFGKLVGYGVALRTDPPHCKAAPSGVTTAVTGGRAGDPSLDGCVEDAGGGNVRLRLINNRPYGMVVTAPVGATLETVSRGGLLAALYQDQNSLAHVGGDYLPAGGEADYLMPASGPTVTAVGAWSWKTYTLDAAVGMLLTVAGEGAPPAGAAVAAKVDASATKVSAAKLASVGLCLGDKMFSDPPTTAASAIRDNIGCLGELNDIWLAPLALVQGLIIDLAGALDAGQDLSVGSAGTVTVSRPARQMIPSPTDTGAAFYGRWRVHGGGLTVNRDGTAVGNNHVGNTADGGGFIYEIDVYRISLSADGTSAVLTTTDVYWGVYNSAGQVQRMPNPDPSYVITVVGDRFSLRLLRPQLLKTTPFPGNRNGQGGNPYLCGPHITAPDVALCGA